MPEDLKSDPYLTLKKFAVHPNKLKGVPYSIIEDDIPRIKARYFSIINDPFESDPSNARKFTICFTVHKFNCGQAEGLCTGFLRDQLVSAVKQKFKVHFSHTNRIIHLDADKWLSGLNPIVMVAHGTGVVPFVSVLQRMRNLLKTHSPQLIGPVHLYFGIRSDDSVNFL